MTHSITFRSLSVGLLLLAVSFGSNPLVYAGDGGTGDGGTVDGGTVDGGSSKEVTQDNQDSSPKTKKSSKVKGRAKAKASSSTSKNLDSQYVRIREAAGEPQALETAIVRFVGSPGSPFEGRVVDLVGVVHIGQLEYYKELNGRLNKYDVVLYELVAPDGTRIEPKDLEERRSLLASMQTGMKEMLNLEYQLEHIDYMAKNFRHADMSPDEFMEDMASRGDGIWKMVARMMGAGLATQATNGGDAGLLMALVSNDRPKALKRVMARQLTDAEAVTAGMDDETGENTLIKGRNRKAFEVLRKELDAGKKNIAVFYGAGHLSDMAERLERDFGMKPTTTTWLAAWDLQKN